MAEENTVKKKVDESWKETVAADKTSGGKEADPAAASAIPDQELPEVTFGVIVSGFMMEALVSMGELEHPISKKKEEDLRHAKFVIDTLGILKDKTNGNLSKDETSLLESVLYDLRMRFMKKQSSSKKG